MIQVQELDRSQEVEHSVRIDVEMEPSRHVALPLMGAWDGMATVSGRLHAAVI